MYFTVPNSDYIIVSTGGFFFLDHSLKLICLAWNWQTQKAELRDPVFCQDISLCVSSGESKINSQGGLYQWGVNSSRHEAHNGLGLKVNWNLIMSSPHLAQLPEFVRHSPHATSVINAWTPSCETTGTLEQRPFHCSSSCAFPFFFLLSPTVPPPSPANSPPTLSSSSAQKTHFLMSLLNQNAARQTDVVRGPTCGFTDINEQVGCGKMWSVDLIYSFFYSCWKSAF